MTTRSRRPDPTDNAAKRPRIPLRQTRLDNGAVVVTARLAHLASSHVCVLHRGGPAHEDDDTWGLSHLVEHMVFRGTRRHKDTRAVSLAADAFGGEIGGATWRDRVVYDTRVDAGREREAIGLLCDMLGAPRFEGLEIEKGVLREELLELLNEDGVEIDADNLTARRLFGGHVLSRTIEGTLDTLAGFDLAAVKRFHKQAFGPEHTVISVAGPVQHADVVAAARETFGRLPRGGGARIGQAPAREQKRGGPIVVKDEDSQTHLRLCFPCGGLFDEARYPLSVMTRVLDDGPAARFRAKLIDELGLAYSLWCDVDLYEDRGAVEVGAQVAHDRVGDVVEAVCRELSAIKRRAPRPVEVERVRARLERDLLDMRDAPSHVAESAARGALVGLPLDPERTLARVTSVTPKDVSAAARALFQPEDAVLVLVGLPSRREVQRARRAIEEHLA